MEDFMENSKIALRYWKTVPEENVATALRDWRRFDGQPMKRHTCNTVACFGGWLPAMPEFKEKGVYTFTDGSPALRRGDLNILSSSDLSMHLFGRKDMFFRRGACDFDLFYPARKCELHHPLHCTTCTDHALVVHRLEKNIRRLGGIP